MVAMGDINLGLSQLGQGNVELLEVEMAFQ